MARYNKISRTLWTDGAMLALDPLPCSPTALYLYLATGDRPTRIAGLHRGAASIADDTGWAQDEVQIALDALESKRLIVTSPRPRYVLAIEVLQFDTPTSPNDEKGALAELDELPDVVPVRAARAIILKEGVSEGWWEGSGRASEGIPQGVSKPACRRQEAGGSKQEQEQPPLPPTGGEVKKKRTRKQANPDAEYLIASWYELSGSTAKREGAVHDKRVGRATKFLDAGFPRAHLDEDLHGLSVDSWWRGREDPSQYRSGAAEDVFRQGPQKFWTDVEKIASRIEAARAPYEPRNRKRQSLAVSASLNMVIERDADAGYWLPTLEQIGTKGSPWSDVIEAECLRRIDAEGFGGCELQMLTVEIHESVLPSIRSLLLDGSPLRVDDREVYAGIKVVIERYADADPNRPGRGMLG